VLHKILACRDDLHNRVRGAQLRIVIAFWAGFIRVSFERSAIAFGASAGRTDARNIMAR
jgi:hypothetical protein